MLCRTPGLELPHCPNATHSCCLGTWRLKTAMRLVCLPHNPPSHEGGCFPHDELPNDWQLCSNSSSWLVLMNNLMYSMRKDWSPIPIQRQMRKILFSATIAVWSSTSSLASNKTPHSIVLSGDTTVRSEGHGRCRRREWQTNLWTSRTDDPRFDLKWFAASNSCQEHSVLAFS